MQCVKPKDHNKRHCEVCGKPISGKVWSKRAPQNKILRCIDHLDFPGRWSAEETTLLKQLYPTKSTTELSKILHRSRKAIEHKAYQFGLEKKRVYHFLVACQFCGKELPAAKKLPSEFFVVCEECVKKQRHTPYVEAAYR